MKVKGSTVKRTLVVRRRVLNDLKAKPSAEKSVRLQSHLRMSAEDLEQPDPRFPRRPAREAVESADE